MSCLSVAAIAKSWEENKRLNSRELLEMEDVVWSRVTTLGVSIVNFPVAENLDSLVEKVKSVISRIELGQAADRKVAYEIQNGVHFGDEGRKNQWAEHLSNAKNEFSVFEDEANLLFNQFHSSHLKNLLVVGFSRPLSEESQKAEQFREGIKEIIQRVAFSHLARAYLELEISLL